MTKQSQIIREIEQMIAVGQVQPGQMLPTQKELMDKFGVAMGTVQQALGRLQSRGVVMSTRGRGTMVCDAATLSSAGILRPRVEMLQLDIANSHDVLLSDTAMMIQQTLSNSGFEMRVRTQLPESASELDAWAQQIRAVVVVGQLPSRVLRALKTADRPVIIAGELYDQPRPAGVSQVTVEIDNIVQLAMTSLLNMGHRRIVLTRGFDTIYSKSLSSTFHQIAKQNQIDDCVEDWVIPAQTDGTDVFQKWAAIAPADRPTAAIIDGGQRACRVIYAFQRANIHVPEKISIFAVSGREASQLSIPTLSRVETTSSRFGTRIAEVLLEVLQQRIVIRETLAPQLVLGDTCATVNLPGNVFGNLSGPALDQRSDELSSNLSDSASSGLLPTAASPSA